MSQQIHLPLDTFSQKHSSKRPSQYPDSAKDMEQSDALSISNHSYPCQDQSTSSSSGLGSGSESGGASINGESETSDYQRSTPSPRDDPFQEQNLNNLNSKSKVVFLSFNHFSSCTLLSLILVVYRA